MTTTPITDWLLGAQAPTEVKQVATAEYVNGWNDALTYMEEWFEGAHSKCGNGAAKQCKKVRDMDIIRRLK